MLTIRHEQMIALETYAERQFFDGLVTAASARAPDVSDLRSRVEAVVQRAASYGIFDRDDLLWFIHLDLERGEAWETTEGMGWALEVLDDLTSDVAGRQYRLERRLAEWDSYEH